MRADDVYAILNRKIKNGGGSTPGTTNYNELQNLPKINGVELKGDVSLEDIIVNGNEVSY